jgi:hypothetical protein
MGNRGPAPTGNYGGKSGVLSTRIRPDTRAAIVAAAKKSKQSLSQEIEHRLRRTFIDDDKIEAAFGGRRNYAIMKLISSTIEAANPSLINRDWLDDPDTFDRATKAINGVLQIIRLHGELPNSGSPPYLLDTNVVIDALETMRCVQNAADMLPLPTDNATQRERELAVCKADLGNVAQRGETADAFLRLRELVHKFAPLRRKQVMSPEAMTSDEVLRLNGLADEIAGIEPIIGQNAKSTIPKVKSRKRK